MEIECRIELGYETESEAENVLAAVSVDNEGFVTARREGKSIVSEIRAKNISSLINTIEDYLACVSIAEKTIKEARESPP